MSFKELVLSDLKINPMDLIGKDWWLITAGNENNGYNTMTAAWGSIGAIWDKKINGKKTITPIVSIYIRPQRYTKVFMDKEDYFTLSVFDDSYKKTLGYLGRVSGKDENKIEKAGLTPLFSDNTTYFKEAKMVFVCKKIYMDRLKEESFIDENIILENYSDKDFHYQYIGEILKVYVKE